jgi:hypothetical protein
VGLVTSDATLLEPNTLEFALLQRLYEKRSRRHLRRLADDLAAEARRRDRTLAALLRAKANDLRMLAAINEHSTF